MKYFYMAEAGQLDPFVLVIEGSIPNEDIKAEGYWAAMGTRSQTGQPIPTCDWIDRLVPNALAVWVQDIRSHGGILSMQGNPGSWGMPLFGWN